jgi:hypothetical protein
VLEDYQKAQNKACTGKIREYALVRLRFSRAGMREDYQKAWRRVRTGKIRGSAQVRVRFSQEEVRGDFQRAQGKEPARMAADDSEREFVPEIGSFARENVVKVLGG